MTTHVVAICGSLRGRSYTRIGLEHALVGVEEVGGEGSLIDLREYDLPPLNADLDEQGDSAEVKRRIREADAVLLGTPMYHGSYSGVLKNALDHCGFDEFEGKTVGLLGVAGGAFPISALEHLRTVCRALNSWVLPHQAALPRVSQSFEGSDEETDTLANGLPVHGRFVDEGTGKRVRTLGQRVVQYANIEPDPATFESGQNVGAGD